MEAIEVAAMTKSDMDKGKKRGTVEATMAKIKYDRQIVAIAKVAQAATIYTDDMGIRSFATRAGMTVIGLADLPERPLPPQQDLPFEGGDGEEEAAGPEGEAPT
jgi:hypothetical protein